MAKVREIKLISHSDVFYWWPAWVVGYVMALVSYGRPCQRSSQREQGYETVGATRRRPSSTPRKFPALAAHTYTCASG